MTKVHKLDVLIVDHDDVGIDEITRVLEDQKYPNWCIHPRIIGSAEAEVEWDDNHPLNRIGTRAAEIERLFPRGER